MIPLKNNTKIKSYFKLSYAPIELVPHTIIFNSAYRSACKEYQAFDEADCMAYAPLHCVLYGSNGTKIMDEHDYDRVINSHKLFFQKADSVRSKELIRKLNGEPD